MSSNYSWGSSLGLQCKSAKTGRVYIKREKVSIGPSAGHPVLRHSVSPGSGESSPPRIQGSGDCSLSARDTIPKISVLSKGGPFYGLTQLGLGSYSSRSSIPETTTTTLSLIRSDEPVFSAASIRPAAPCQPTPAVAGPIFSYVRHSDSTFPGGVYDFHRRLYPGAGRPYGGFPNFGYLDPFRSPAPHQLFGATGSSFGPSPLEYSAPGPPGFDRYRQYNSSLLYQKTRRDPFPILVTPSSRSLYVATHSRHSPQSQTNSRLLQCDSRLKTITPKRSLVLALSPDGSAQQ